MYSKLLKISILVFFLTGSLYGKTGSSFSFTGGIAIPNNEVSNIFNSKTIASTDTNNLLLSFNRPDMGIGYTISAKISFPLSENAFFFGGFGLIRFREGQYDLYNESNDESRGYLLAKTSIYPINAGVQYYFLNDILSLYGIGNLSYNFIANSINYKNSKSIIELSNSPNDSRIGYTLGLGLEVPFKLFSVIVETKYSELNYIGKSSSENTKSVIQIEAGFKF